MRRSSRYEFRREAPPYRSCDLVPLARLRPHPCGPAAARRTASARPFEGVRRARARTHRFVAPSAPFSIYFMTRPGRNSLFRNLSEVHYTMHILHILGTRGHVYEYRSAVPGRRPGGRVLAMFLLTSFARALDVLWAVDIRSPHRSRAVAHIAWHLGRTVADHFSQCIQCAAHNYT